MHVGSDVKIVLNSIGLKYITRSDNYENISYHC